MKKLFLVSLMLTITMNMAAQVGIGNADTIVVDKSQLTKMGADDVKDEVKDSDSQSLDDLIRKRDGSGVIGKVTDHFADVWSRKSYINLTYSSTDYKINTPPSDDPNASANRKSNWGGAFNLGTQYNLHKPIGNAATFNIDYSYVNLSVNHYAKDKSYEYDSSKSKKADGKTYYRPWGGDMYEANYGMSIGPSLTLAPFTHVDENAVNAVHYIKFNVFYHIGYNASIAYTKIDDIAPENTRLKETSLIDFGHGVYSEFGFSVSWKSIGIGYERRTGKNEYKLLSDGPFGDAKYKIDNTMSRIYLQIRTGSKISKKKK